MKSKTKNKHLKIEKKSGLAKRNQLEQWLDYHPVTISFGKKTKKGISFVNLNDIVNINASAELRRNIIDIVYLCNGYRSLDDIKKLLPKIPKSRFARIISILKKSRIIFDSRELFLLFHEYSRVPLTVAHDLGTKDIAKLKKQEEQKFKIGGKRIPLQKTSGHILNLIKKRKSTRWFKDIPISFDHLSGLLQSMYSVTEDFKAVPSAGAFYPLKIYVFLLRDIDPIKKGVYLYDHYKSELIKIKEKGLASSQMTSMLIGSKLIKNASLFICVASDFKSTTLKYSNRGYRHIFLESGHVAQNAYLYCAEKNLGVVEYGGFNDVELAHYLDLTFPQQAVNTALMVGVKHETSKKFSEDYVEEELMLRRILVSHQKLLVRISNKIFHYGKYAMPYYAACAKYIRFDEKKKGSIQKSYSAFGLGTTALEAKFKAMVEGYERHASGVYRIDRMCSEMELSAKFFDSNNIASQSKQYLSRVGLIKRNPSSTIAWVQGYKYVSGEKVFIPTDQVFYPLTKKKLGCKLSYKANSNGVAAHTNFDSAFKNALFELVERDSISVMWYSKNTPPIISNDILPFEIRERIGYLEKLGRKIYFLDITLDMMPVILCITTGGEYPHTTVGCSANLDPGAAALKAFNEAELIFHSWRNKKREKKKINEVFSATDHGDFYAQISIYKHPKLKWLLNGKVHHTFKDPKKSIKSIIKAIDPVVIDINPKNRIGGLYVVRVMSEYLVPFTFGYMSEHYRHPRLKMLGYKWSWEYPAFPHLLA